MPGMTAPLASLLPAITQAAETAGERIMDIYATDFDVDRKADNSPVTQADLAAEAIILAVLAELTPEIPVIAEEEMSAGTSPSAVGDRFWLVDPLDGTREFLDRNDDFTVNIGLIDHGEPVLGVVHLPVQRHTYTGLSGVGATCSVNAGPVRPITVREVPPDGMTLVSSLHHGNPAALEKFLQDKRIAKRMVRGSSLKFCVVAAGEADVYPRFGPTMEWDTAAGHAVLNAAGGCITTVDGAPLRYGKKDFLNPNFIAWGDRQATAS
jgi:3'(2'), 5'-bisphosphate nucleotidase